MQQLRGSLGFKMFSDALACSAHLLPFDEGHLPCARQAHEKEKFVALIFNTS
jgi:hypothetical protein